MKKCNLWLIVASSACALFCVDASEADDWYCVKSCNQATCQPASPPVECYCAFPGDLDGTCTGAYAVAVEGIWNVVLAEKGESGMYYKGETKLCLTIYDCARWDNPGNKDCTSSADCTFWETYIVQTEYTLQDEQPCKGL